MYISCFSVSLKRGMLWAWREGFHVSYRVTSALTCPSSEEPQLPRDAGLPSSVYESSPKGLSWLWCDFHLKTETQSQFCAGGKGADGTIYSCFWKPGPCGLCLFKTFPTRAKQMKYHPFLCWWQNILYSKKMWWNRNLSIWMTIHLNCRCLQTSSGSCWNHKSWCWKDTAKKQNRRENDSPWASDGNYLQCQCTKLNHTRNRKVWCWLKPFVKYPNLRGLHGERFPLKAALFQDISSNSSLPPGQKYQDNFLVYSIFALLHKSVPKSKVYRVIRGRNIRKECERNNRNGIFFPKIFVTSGVTCAKERWISKADNCILMLLIKQLDNCIRGSQKCPINADYILFSPGNFKQTVCP